MALKTFPVVLVTGPRQSGKTTLVKNFLSDRYNYVSLDELDIRALAVSDPRGFLDRHSSPVIIDEIQNVPELLPYIKGRIDENKKPGQWILTGSQQFSMMRNVSESLAGRIAILPLHTFSISEMNNNLRLRLDNAASFIDSLANKKTTGRKTSLSCGAWLLNGGYPELFVNRQISRKLWFSSYIQTYIDRDVRGNIKSANLNDFERFLKLLAARTSQELNYTSISRVIGLSVPTIKSWVSFLEASSIIYLLNPYHKNFGKRIIKSPKCYFMDTGLASYLTGLHTEEHLLDGPMAGPLFETACVTQFVRRFSAFLEPGAVYFWKSVDGFEVDLLVDTADGLIPIEMKLSSTISSHHLSSLKAWMQISKSKIQNGLIISQAKTHGPLASNISNCHFSRL